MEADHLVCAEGRAAEVRRVAAGSAGSGAKGFDGTVAGDGSGWNSSEEGQGGKGAGGAVLVDVIWKDSDADFKGDGGMGTEASVGGFVSGGRDGEYEVFGG